MKKIALLLLLISTTTRPMESQPSSVEIQEALQQAQLAAAHRAQAPEVNLQKKDEALKQRLKRHCTQYKVCYGTAWGLTALFIIIGAAAYIAEQAA